MGEVRESTGARMARRPLRAKSIPFGRARGSAACAFALVWVLAGCADRQLMPTPNLYVDAAENPFANVPDALRTNTVDVLYATDREPLPTKDGMLAYGSKRSKSLCFGSSVVEIGRDVSWDALVEDSTSHHRANSLPLRVTEMNPLGCFPATPVSVVRDETGLHVEPGAQAEQDAAVATLHAELARRLAVTPRKDVVLFVHGYNNTLEDGVFRIAELSHFLGREFVPILYSWPAGAGGGLLRGYTRDTESADFTVFHLKEFLRAIASCPQVERINIVAHSRGNAVIIAAIRELFVESRGAHADFRRQYKIHNAVLAAADVDVDVMEQRVMAERMGAGVDRITVYISDTDKALGISGWLFGSIERVGRLRSNDVEEMRNKLPNLRGIAFVDARVNTGFIGHGYFQDDPAVSSDLVLVLRYDRDPGEANGRPLKQIAPNFWQIDESYPNSRVPRPDEDLVGVAVDSHADSN